MRLTDAVAAFMIAVLSGMGVGSGGLLVVWLTFVDGMAQLEAQGVNLLFFIFSSGVSSAVNAYKRDIPWNIVLILAAGGLAGAAIGTSLSSVVSAELLRSLFGAMLVWSGARSLFKSVTGYIKREKSPRSGSGGKIP